jgi:glycosyltransferase involved in cell wall biosynthesis
MTTPFVSLCTATFNRRPFFQALIKCILAQDYPHDHMEWIIVDDGTDKVQDLVKYLPFVKYFPISEKMSLGQKRNLMNRKASGSILVYMDDDDYYPPTRVSHAVQKLQENPTALCAGSSAMYIYFPKLQKMYRFGPYGPNHATAATFAFRKALLKQTRFEHDAALAEEKGFLKNYTIPFVQLDPKHSILVVAHAHNSFDKHRLLDNLNPKFTELVSETPSDFIADPALLKFYTEDVHARLVDYEPGRPNMKPDVIKQMVSMEKERRKIIEQAQAQQPVIAYSTTPNGPAINLTMEQVCQMLSKQQEEIAQLKKLLQGKDAEITYLQSLNKMA